MTDLGTLAGLLEHRHELAVYCPRCDRWAVIALLSWSMPAAAIDACRSGCGVVCGGLSRLQVRPPAPTRSSFGAGRSRRRNPEACVLPDALGAALARG
jgi:hypothetical protein